MSEKGDDEGAAEARRLLDSAEHGTLYLAALSTLVMNYPPQMTMADKAVCTEAAAHLMETAYQSDDYLAEALSRCTPEERGWCMWLDLTATLTAERLASVAFLK